MFDFKLPLTHTVVRSASYHLYLVIVIESQDKSAALRLMEATDNGVYKNLHEAATAVTQEPAEKVKTYTDQAIKALTLALLTC